LPNIWNYHQTRGFGYHEYFQFCEDIGAEPLPVVAAGVPCQNSGRASKHSHDVLTAYGQQTGIPMEEMDAYVQDILDLIEYANGDTKKTAWGKKRAENGHSKPFNLKYIGIGNEDQITDVFEERFRMIYKAVQDKYPEITVIGTVGPFYKGSDYTEGWKLADNLNIPMVDEHYYNTPGWFIYNQDFYDKYDRNKSKVYLGEYAAHLPWRPNNIETALSEALYLTAVERNGDVVQMSSYAPLLAKEGHTNWNPDLIYFNNKEVKPTVGYFVQQLFSKYSGTTYLGNQLEVESDKFGVKERIGFSSLEDERGNLILKMVNLLPVEVNFELSEQIVNRKDKIIITETLLSGSPSETNAKPVERDITIDKLENYVLQPYSFVVIKIQNK
jgi:alpha-L-arabinofuranosidase